MRGARNLACLALSVGLAGCGMITLKPQKPAETAEAPRSQPQTPQPRIIRIESDVEKLVQYFEQIKGYAAPQLSQEYERVRQGYMSEKSDFLRLKLVLFAILPSASAAEHARGLGLIEPLLKDTTESSPTRSFAQLLYAVLSEQKKLEEGVQGLNLKLKEGQRREQALQEKLDALKEMETTLMERERALPTKKK